MARKEAPVPPKAGAMPAHDRLRLHDQQDARPFWPQATEGEPEEAIPPAQLGSRVLVFENGELMTQGDKLKSEVIPRAEERAEPSKESREKPGHRNRLHDGFNLKATVCKSLILRVSSILRTHRLRHIASRQRLRNLDAGASLWALAESNYDNEASVFTRMKSLPEHFTC